MRAGARCRVPGIIWFFIMFSFPCFLPGADEISVHLKIAPPEAELYLQGKLLEPEGENRGVRTYRMEAPEGELFSSSFHLYLSAPGYRDQIILHPSLSAELQDGATRDVQLQPLDSALQLEALVTTGSQPKSVLFIRRGSYIATALLNGPGIEIFDTGSMERVAAPSPDPEDAEKLGFVELLELPDRRELWVSQMTTNSIHIFDLESFRYLRSISSGGNWPKVLLAREDEERVYVSNWTGMNVTEIDTRSGKVLRRFPIPGIPRGLVLSPDERTLYVSNYSNGTIEVVDLQSGRSRSWETGPGAMRHLTISPDGTSLYGSDMLQGTVLRMDLKGERVLWERRIGPNLNTLEIDPTGMLLYVSSRGRNGKDGYLYEGEEFGTVSCLDAETGRILETVWGGDQPTGLDLSPDGSLLAFTDFLDHRIEIFRIEAGDSPW